VRRSWRRQKLDLALSSLVVSACLGVASRARADPEPSTAPAAEQRSESWVVPGLHGAALMTSMRLGAALIWPDPFASTDLGLWGENYERAFTLPPRWDSERAVFEWDGDPWYVNAVGHALFGSELYLRTRTCGKSPLEGLAFTALGSAVWEYGFEANAVRPSALDLVYTPISGIVLGEARYWGWSAAAGIRDRTWRGVLMAVFDPFGELERAAKTPC
jgi:hypothetical protein